MIISKNDDLTIDDIKQGGMQERYSAVLNEKCVIRQRYRS